MKQKAALFKDQPALCLLCVLAALLIGGIGLGFSILRNASLELYKYASFPTGTSPGVADNVSRGWLPEWFPPTASNIEHGHDLDTNLSLTHFSLPSVESESLVTSSCLQWESAKDHLFVPGAFRGMERWNRSDLTAGIRSGETRLYKCDEPDGQEWVLALQPVSGQQWFHAFLWNNPSLK